MTGVAMSYERNLSTRNVEGKALFRTAERVGIARPQLSH